MTHSEIKATIHPQPDRYQLVWAEACPFASRVKIARDLLGLEEVIAVSTTNTVNQDIWNFAHYPQGKDPVLGVTDVRELYLSNHPDYQGPYSVPILYDKVEEEVVGKESADLVRHLATQWRDYHKEGAPDLCPDNLVDAIDQANDLWFQRIQGGLSALGAAQTQEDYNRASELFFNNLELLDQHLSENRYFHGETITETDIFLYVIAVRWDAVYYHKSAANRYRITDFPHLWNYFYDLHQIPAFGDNTHFDAIKEHSYLGKHGGQTIVPDGPDLSIWD